MAPGVESLQQAQTESGDQVPLPNSIAETQPLTADRPEADSTTTAPAATDAAGTADGAMMEEEPAEARSLCASLASLRSVPQKAIDKYVEQVKGWKQRKKDEMRMCGASFCHFCCWPESQEQRQAWVAAQARLQQLESDAARLIKWTVGDTVDVDTEDGPEKGAVIIGPADSGAQTQMRIRFADGRNCGRLGYGGFHSCICCTRHIKMVYPRMSARQQLHEP